MLLNQSVAGDQQRIGLDIGQADRPDSERLAFAKADMPFHRETYEFQPRIEKLLFNIGKFSARLDRHSNLSQFHHLMSQWDAVIAGGSSMPGLDLLELLVHANDGPGVRIPHGIYSLAILNVETVLKGERPTTAQDFEQIADAAQSIAAGRMTHSGHRYQIGSSPWPQKSERIVKILEFVTARGQMPFFMRLALSVAQLWSALPDAVDGQSVCPAFTTMILRWEGLPPLFLSQAFIRQGAMLRVALTSGQATGDWNPWCVKFLDAIEDALVRTEQYFDALDRLTTNWVDDLNAVGVHAHSSTFSIVGSLASDPIVTAGGLAKRLGVSIQAANKGISNLVSLGILRLYGAAGRNRSFYTPDVLAVFNDSGP